MDWDKIEQKEIVKEAFKEWLDEKTLEFGKWTIQFISMACFGALLYFLVSYGFIK